MSITDTIGQVAASNPAVGAAVASAQTQSAVLAGLLTGDTSLGSLVGTADMQAQEAGALLSQLMPNLGQNVNTTA